MFTELIEIHYVESLPNPEDFLVFLFHYLYNVFRIKIELHHLI